MRKTVKEIIDMIDNNELYYDHSTQRKFIYEDMTAQTNDGKLTKAGSLIYSILEYNIQLPSLYFWHNTDTGDTNIHDGKQRILSLYYFITGKYVPGKTAPIVTIRHGKQKTFNGLSPEDQQKLKDYTFNIDERWGNTIEEEISFDLLNSNSVNLTPYETLTTLHGEWLSGYEDHIELLHKTYPDTIKEIGRGEQAYSILLTMFNIPDSKKAAFNDPSRLNLKNAIRPLRHHIFNQADFDLDEILDTYASLKIMKFSNGQNQKLTNLDDTVALRVAYYIVKNYLKRKDDILDLFRRSTLVPNDIARWTIDFIKTDVQTFKCFIDKFIKEGLELDPLRFFPDSIRQELYRERGGQCEFEDPITHKRCDETNYTKMQVDHIDAWSKGGRTIKSNARLLCEHHNKSLGNRGE